MDIASPWDHIVYEKEGEKIEKYQDLKREIGKLWGIRQQEVVPVVVGALGAVRKKSDTWLEPGPLDLESSTLATRPLSRLLHIMYYITPYYITVT